MIVDVRTSTYVAAVASAIEAGKVFPQMSSTCPECGGELGFFDTGDHIVMEDPRTKDQPTNDADPGVGRVVVIVACEGYWVINPNLVGIMSETWMAQDDPRFLGEELPPVGAADTPAGIAPDGLGEEIIITKGEIWTALEKYVSLPPLSCGHPRYGDTDHCGEMMCSNYVGKSPTWGPWGSEGRPEGHSER